MNITIEEFRTYFNINPTGNIDLSFNEMNEILDIKPAERDSNGFKVTFELIVEKYQKYVDMWKKSKGARDPKYISKADELISPWDFLLKKKYLELFQEPKGKRERYLFGAMDEVELRSSLHDFLNSLGVPIKGQVVKPLNSNIILHSKVADYGSEKESSFESDAPPNW